MTLRRQVTVNPPTYADVLLCGFLRGYEPGELTGGVQQGDAQVSILADEIAAAGWPAPPRARDLLVVDGRTWAVQGATPVAVGGAVLGWRLWIRGGAT